MSAIALVALLFIQNPPGMPVPCASREEVVAMLAKHNEKVIFQGMVDGEAPILMEQFMSKPDRMGDVTWTFVRTSIVKDGTISCIISVGHAWEQVDDYDPRT